MKILKMHLLLAMVQGTSVLRAVKWITVADQAPSNKKVEAMEPVSVLEEELPLKAKESNEIQLNVLCFMNRKLQIRESA